MIIETPTDTVLSIWTSQSPNWTLADVAGPATTSPAPTSALTPSKRILLLNIEPSSKRLYLSFPLRTPIRLSPESFSTFEACATKINCVNNIFFKIRDFNLIKICDAYLQHLKGAP